MIDRAKEIVAKLVDADISAKAKQIALDSKPAKKNKNFATDDVDMAQMSLFDTVKDDDVLTELKNLDVQNMTPMDALNTLFKLQNKLNNRWLSQ